MIATAWTPSDWFAGGQLLLAVIGGGGGFLGGLSWWSQHKERKRLAALEESTRWRIHGVGSNNARAVYEVTNTLSTPAENVTFSVDQGASGSTRIAFPPAPITFAGLRSERYVQEWRTGTSRRPEYVTVSWDGTKTSRVRVEPDTP